MSKLKAKFQIRSLTLTLIVTLLFTSIYNRKIWEIYATAHTVNDLSTSIEAISFAFFLFFLMFSLFNLFALKWLQKPILVLVFISSSAALYFSNTLNVYFDTTMINNLFATDYSEARELFVTPIFVSVLIFGAIPVAVLLHLCPTYKPWHRQFGQNILLSALALGLAFGAGAPYYANHASFIRNNNVALSESLLPTSYTISTASYLKEQYLPKNETRIAIDTNPTKSKSWDAYKKPLAVVFILGETARASSFSLQKDINSGALGSLTNLFYYPDFSSCGTSTVVSVPCMFSTYSKADFSRSMRMQYENVMDIATRSGFNTYWLDNHNGCKGVCEGIGIHYVDQKSSPQFEHEGAYFDEALVDKLAEQISSIEGDQMRVLHQLGSHGPAYYKRMPPSFLVSEPSCLTEDLSQCTVEQITNTYNDSVRYTEYVIEKAIKQLESLKETHDTALIYVSDHGESTGNNGLYLHGIPMFLAPSDQTHVPALMWLSESYISSRNIDTQCLNSTLGNAYSHDNVSHTLLGLLDINSTAYNADLSLLHQCTARQPSIADLMNKGLNKVVIKAPSKSVINPA